MRLQLLRDIEGCEDYSSKKKDECSTDPSPYVSRGKLSKFSPSNLVMAQRTCRFRVADEAIIEKDPDQLRNVRMSYPSC